MALQTILLALLITVMAVILALQTKILGKPTVKTTVMMHKVATQASKVILMIALGKAPPVTELLKKPLAAIRRMK